MLALMLLAALVLGVLVVAPATLATIARGIREARKVRRELLDLERRDEWFRSHHHGGGIWR